MNEHLPEWYQEITKELGPKKMITPEKKIIIDYLRDLINELEAN